MILNRNGTGGKTRVKPRSLGETMSSFLFRESLLLLPTTNQPRPLREASIYLHLLFEYESNITVNKVGEVSLLGVRGELVFFLVGLRTEDDIIFCRYLMLRSEAEALSVFVSIFCE
jgi:hypothetical protein